MMEEWIDPFDLLEQHEVMINRLVAAHNEQQKLLEHLAKQQQILSDFVVKTNERLNRIDT